MFIKSFLFVLSIKFTVENIVVIGVLINFSIIKHPNFYSSL